MPDPLDELLRESYERGRRRAIEERERDWASPALQEDEPSLLSRIASGVASGVGTVLGLPKELLVNVPYRWGARELGLDVPETATPEAGLRAGLGLAPGQEAGQGYAERMAGGLLETGAGMALDPLLWALPGLHEAAVAGAPAEAALAMSTRLTPEAQAAAASLVQRADLAKKVGAAAGGAFGGLMTLGALESGKQAYDVIRDQGLTPEAAEHVVSTLVAGAGAAATLPRAVGEIREFARPAPMVPREPLAPPVAEVPGPRIVPTERVPPEAAAAPAGAPEALALETQQRLQELRSRMAERLKEPGVAEIVPERPRPPIGPPETVPVAVLTPPERPVEVPAPPPKVEARLPPEAPAEPWEEALRPALAIPPGAPPPEALPPPEERLRVAATARAEVQAEEAARQARALEIARAREEQERRVEEPRLPAVPDLAARLPEVRPSLRLEERPAAKPTLAVRDLAARYVAERRRAEPEFVPHDEARAKRIADAYAAARHEPEAPAVRSSYEALKLDIRDQWDYLVREGYRLEPWTAEGQPYPDSASMRRDVAQNKHLYFFMGGEMPADHPLAERALGNLTYNDMFRAVHDVFGHAKEGFQFGPRGEEWAWREHSRMFSPEARPAMTTETRGQNAWVNFGAHLRGPGGEVPRAGEPGYVAPPMRPFAEQKAVVLPEEFLRERTREYGVAVTTLNELVPQPQARLNADYERKLLAGKALARPPRTPPKLNAEGMVVAGTPTFEQWLDRATRMLGEPSGPTWKEARNWYADLHGAFERYYGPEEAPRRLMLWALSQQRASPSMGQLNAMRALDKASGTRKLKTAGLGEDRMLAAIAGRSEGVGQKLSDFMDSVLGKPKRAWTGGEGELQPAAVDVWAMRDLGYVDDQVASRHGLRKDTGAPKPNQYLYGVQKYNEFARLLNERNVDGGGWTPSQAQALGWVAMQRAQGQAPEHVGEIFDVNTRRALAEVTGFAEGSPLAERVGTMSEARSRAVTEALAPQLYERAAKLVGATVVDVKVGTGVWSGGFNANAITRILGTPEQVQDFIGIVGRVANQGEVLAIREGGRSDPAGFSVSTTAAMDRPEKTVAVWNAAAKQVPELTSTGMSVLVDPDGGTRLVVLQGGVEPSKWNKRLFDRMDKAFRYAVGQVDSRARVDTMASRFEVLRSVNDWSKDKNGEGHLREPLGRRPALREAGALDDLVRWFESSVERRGTEAEARAGAPRERAVAAPAVAPEPARGPPEVPPQVRAEATAPEQAAESRPSYFLREGTRVYDLDRDPEGLVRKATQEAFALRRLQVEPEAPFGAGLDEVLQRAGYQAYRHGGRLVALGQEPGFGQERHERARTPEDARAAGQRALDRLEKPQPISAVSGDVTPSGVRTLGLAITQEARRTGWIDLRGREVRGPQDMAVAAQALRNPSFESFYVVAVSGDRVVGHQGFTSRIPGSAVTARSFRDVAEIQRWLDRTRAEAYYLLHNHNSGDPVPSANDVRLTVRMYDDIQKAAAMTGTRVPEMRGHVVIDSGKFGFIDREGVIGPLQDVPGWDDSHEALLKTSVPHPDLGRETAAPRLVAQIGAALHEDPTLVTVGYLDAQMRLRAIQQIPIGLYTSPDVVNFLRGRIREFGATSGAWVYHAKSRALALRSADLVRRGALLDAAMEHADATLRQTGLVEPPRPNPREWMGRPVERHRVAELTGGYEVRPPGLPTELERERAQEAARRAGVPVDVGTGKPPEFAINLERIELPQDLVEMEAQVAEELDAKLGRARSYRSWQEAKEVAERSGLTEEDFLRILGEKGAVTDHEVLAGRMLRERAAVDTKAALDEVARARAEGRDTLEAEREYSRAITRLASTLYGTVRAGAEAGRALAIHRMMSEPLTAQERLLRVASKRFPAMATEFRDAITKAIAENDQAEVQRLLRQAFKPSIMDMVNEYFTNSLVSALPTMGGNGVGNTLYEAAIRTPERGIGAWLESSKVREWIERRLRGEATPGQQRFGREMEEAFRANWRLKFGWPRMMKMVWHAIVNEQPLAAGLEKEGYYARQAIPGVAGKIIRTPTRILNAMDEGAKIPAAEAESASLAVRIATQEGMRNRWSPEQWAERFNGIRSRGSDWYDLYLRRRTGEILTREELTRFRDRFSEKIGRQIALAADKATFHDEASALEKLLLTAKVKYPVLHLIAPFIKTPGRILAAAYQRTPLALPGLIARIRSGELRGGEISDELAKQVLGTMLGVSFFSMAKSGMLTGSGPTDPRRQALWKETGAQPYAVKVGDQFVQYRRLEPLSTILGIASDLAEATDEKQRKDLWQKLQGALVQNITQKSFLTGVINFAEAVGDPMRYGATFVRGLQGSIVPNAVAKMAQAVDPVVRDVKGETLMQTALRPIAARIPGFSMLLPAKVAPTGEPVERQATALERFASPLPRTTRKPGVELEELMLALDVEPGPIPGEISVRGVKVPLTQDERELLAASRQAATNYLKQKIVGQSWFRSLPDTRDEGGDSSKEQVIRKLYDRFSSRAREMLARSAEVQARAVEELRSRRAAR